MTSNFGSIVLGSLVIGPSFLIKSMFGWLDNEFLNKHIKIVDEAAYSLIVLTGDPFYAAAK